MYAELLVEVFGKVLGRIYGAVLAACTAETYGQVGKSPFHIPFHGCIYQTIYVFEEYGDFPILFKEADNGLVEAGERLVTFVFARVVYGTAVEYETAAVAGRIFGDTFFIGETVTFTTRRRFCRSSVNCFSSVSLCRTLQRYGYSG